MLLMLNSLLFIIVKTCKGNDTGNKKYLVEFYQILLLETVSNNENL